MKKSEAIVDWSYEGKPDFIVGTGALKIERYLVLLVGLFAAAIYLILWYIDYFFWSSWQYLLAAFIAFDIFGGVVANTLNSCKRFYHAPLSKNDPNYIKFLKTGINFDLLHIHTLIVAILYPDISILRGFVWYVTLIANVVMVYFAPLYLKRPIAFLLISIAVVAHQYLISLGSGFEWLVPLIFLKIVYGHSVREEPYRPIHT